MDPIPMDPFVLALDAASGKLEPATSKITRHLSDMRGMYADGTAEQAAIEGGDSLVYEVLQYDVPAATGQLLMCTTILQPGCVGDEYYMTTGHYHARRATSEVYLGLRGRGVLLMQADARHVTVELAPGRAAYIPPYWAHRTVNTGDEPLIFFAVCRADAGHDYETIAREGFPQRVIRREGAAVLVPAKRR
jgi:glucose-6-phosphate isomerase